METELIGRNIDQLEERRLNKFFVTGRGSKTNPIYPLIESAIVTAFSESIADADTDILEKCYVSSPDRTKFDNRIKMHLSKREPLFNTAPVRPMSKKQDKGTKILADVLKSAETAGRPLAILILGEVGVGKTTFIKYTRKITAESYFRISKAKEYPHWIEIDFRDFSQSENPLDFIVGKIKDYFYEDDFFSNYDRAIRSAYKREFEALRRGHLSLLAKNEEKIEEKYAEIIDKDFKAGLPYVEKLLSYAASKLPIFLVIDNVDQFEDENVQSEIFSDTIALAHRLGLSLIMAMRESTFIKHRNSPKFDAFDFDPIQLEPPQIRQVLSRRFFVAENLLRGKSGEFVSSNGALFKVNELSDFIAIVKGSVLGTEVGNTIEMLAAHDVRFALAMTRNFLERGYTDPDKALKFHQSGKDYILPKHEALRAIVVGNQPVYSEEYSVIGNVFDARQGKTGAELLRVFMLSSLVKLSSDKTFDYESGVAIRESTQKLGFSNDHVLNVLRDLCDMHFLHTASHGPAEFSANFFPTQLGGFILRELLGKFAFVENMLMDTFIPDGEVWRSLWTQSESIKEERDISKRVRLRVQRVKTFYNYMLSLYSPIIEEARRRSLRAEWCANILEEMKSPLFSDCARALESVRRNYGNKGS